MNVRDLIPWNRGRQEVAPRNQAESGVNALQFDFNRAFDEFWRSFERPLFGGLTSGGSWGMPPVDVRQTDKEVEVVAELPGMDEGDVDVQVSNGVLTIRGEKRSERKSEEKGYVLRERRFGRIERMVPLPEGVDIDSAKAAFKNGVLTVKLEKTAEAQAAVRRIPVHHK